MDKLTITCIRNKYMQNTFVVQNSTHYILIDAGTDASRILPHVQNKTCSGIFLTHCHYDHTCSVINLAKELHAKVFASKTMLVNLKDASVNGSNYFRKNEQIDLVAQNIKLEFIQDEQKINILGTTIKCIKTAGHSSCSYCFLLQDNLFTGDTLFQDCIGRYDFQTSSGASLLNSLKKLLNVNASTYLSGHGSNSTKDQQKENIKYWIEYLSKN